MHNKRGWAIEQEIKSLLINKPTSIFHPELSTHSTLKADLEEKKKYRNWRNCICSVCIQHMNMCIRVKCVCSILTCWLAQSNTLTSFCHFPSEMAIAILKAVPLLQLKWSLTSWRPEGLSQHRYRFQLQNSQRKHSVVAKKKREKSCLLKHTGARNITPWFVKNKSRTGHSVIGN